MITRRETGRGSQSQTEGSPHLGDELGTPVRDDVRGDAVYVENLGYHELCGLSRGGKSGQCDEVGCLRKPIYDGENGGVISGWRETDFKIQSDVGPRKTGERQVAKQSRPGLVGCLAACTGGTCGDERPGVPIHGRPPEPVVQEGQGAVDPGMTSQPRRMTPLQNVRANCIRNEQPTGWTSPRIGLVSLGLGHQGLDFPDQRGHYAGGR
jgi:hypothetical protein